jgi:hypothetical protein
MVLNFKITLIVKNGDVMPLNLSGFNPGFLPAGSAAEQWKNAAVDVADRLSSAQGELTNAYTTNNMSLIQEKQVAYERMKQIFEMLQNMMKSANDLVMNLIRRLDPR